MISSDLSKQVYEGNNLILERLSSSKTTAIGRLGSVESNLLAAFEAGNVTHRNKWEAWINAGISYPTKSVINQFSTAYFESISTLDGLAMWPTNLLPSQEYLISEHLPKTSFLIPLRSLDPVQMVASGLSSTEVWTSAMKNKNVLVVHSFSDLICSQYSKNSSLHKTKILPEFNLHTLTPPVTNGLTFWKGSYTTNLNKMNIIIEDYVSKSSIDLALVAAGSYGLPITSKLKTLGISTVYMGGSLQLLFGILGKRWQDIPEIKASYTNSWIDGSKENHPLGYKLIDRGTYW